MKWSEVVTHDDAYASLVRSQHRREVVEIRRRRRLRWRGLLFMPFLLGLGLLGWAATSYDDPNLQAWKVIVGMALIVPMLATFDWLGEARR